MTDTKARADLAAAAQAEVDRWERAIADELSRVFDRQERVVLARLQGTKARKHTRHWDPPGERKIDPKYVVDPARWALDAVASLRPLLGRVFGDVYGRVSKKLRDATPAGVEAPKPQATGPDLDTRVSEGLELRLRRIAEGVQTAREEVEAYIEKEEDAGSTMADMVKGVRDLYEARKPAWVDRIATASAVGSINQAGIYAAADAGSSAKQWLSRRDDKVRSSHEHADGQVRLLDERFKVGEQKSLLWFPGDPSPSVPAGEVINCRCMLLFSPPKRAAKADDPALEEKAVTRRVRTPSGARTYGQPIGSVIVPDPTTSGVSAPASPSSASSSSGSTSKPRRLGKVDGKQVELIRAGDDPAIDKMYVDHQRSTLPAGAKLVVLRDRKGRIGAYVAWDSNGDVLAVSVHPGLRGRRIGDQLLAEAMQADRKVKPARPRSTPAAAPRASNPVARSSKPAPAAKPVSKRARIDPATGDPIITNRAGAGDTAGTSGDFKADAARIERLQTAYMADGASTSALYSKAGRWDRGREKQQQAIIDHFLGKPGVKKDRKLVVLGGLPGAGKTTTINSPAGQAALGIDLGDYVTVNADEVKAEMIARGMVPEYPGLTPDEAATLFHAESFEVAHALMRQAARGGYNFVYDTSLKSSAQASFATDAARRQAPPGYETTMVFVDVPVPVAKQRARDRYLAGDRYMPLGLIDAMKGSGRRSSGPAEEFDRVKATADRWVVFDNAGADPVLTGSGGRRAGRSGGNGGTSPAPVVSRPARTPAPAPTQVAAATSTSNGTGSSVGSSAIQVPAALPAPPPGARVFSHPQGKHIYLLPDGSLVVYKPDGKRGTSSATKAKLEAGYGGWSELGTAPAGPPLAATPTPPAPAPAAAQPRTGTNPTVVAAPKAPLQVSAGAPPPSGSLPVSPMDFNEAPLADVPKYIADPAYVFQQKVDGIRGVLVVEPGKAPWFASKKGDRLVSSTAAKTTAPMLAKMPATPPGSPAYRVEGEILDGKFHVFDMVVVGQESTDYDTRKAMADAWVEAVQDSLKQVVALPTARTTAEKQALWDKVLDSGAEGVMMKRRDAGYTGGQRVSHTLKAKITATADVVVMERNRGGKDNAVFGLRNAAGDVIEIGTVSTGGKDKALGQIQVGDILELEYLWATPAGTLTQPRILRKRPDKNANDATQLDQLRVVDKTVLALAAKRMRLDLEQKAGA